MSPSRVFRLLLLIPCAFGLPAVAAETPTWAYPINPPEFKFRSDDGFMRHVPDSAAAFSINQLRDRFSAADWHPDDHPSLPPIVAQGRKPSVFACGFCHRPDGAGGPENASLAGLPTAYIAQQMADYKSGARSTSVLKRNIDLMIALAKDMTDVEVGEAATYFAALKVTPLIKVLEVDTVPKTFVAGWFYAVANGKSQEPIGHRIVEVPDDLERFENHDPRVRFTAYVPKGSIANGESMVKTGAGKTIACTLCHGANLKGMNSTPSIAGRSPSYVVRQLYDMQTGVRAGVTTQMMKATVANLSNDDMIAIAAYLASRAP